MFRVRSLLLISILLLSFSWLSSSVVKDKGKVNHLNSISGSSNAFLKARLKAIEAKKFALKNNFNSTICFLVDMSQPSGQNRFFVYDLAKDTLQNSGLVAHGNCYQDWLTGRRYDNKVGCGCTSLGKHRVGYSYFGRFGLAFKLYGLDSTNNKAFERFVVLHAHSCVPETAVNDEICQSNGCPMVATGFLQQLKPLIQASKKPVLLWIYE